MIDTIRLKIPIKDLNESKMLCITSQKEEKIQYKIFRDVISVGSYSYFVNLFINCAGELFLEFSLPKFLYSHNIREAHFDDILPALGKIHDVLSGFCTCPPPISWQVMRIDMCKYIKSSNPYSDIFLYQSLQYPRKKKYIYDTSVMFVGATYSTKFYIKEAEFFKHDFKKISKTDISFAYELLNMSKGLIRVETSYRSKALKSIFGLKNVSVYDTLKLKGDLIKHHEVILSKLYGDIDPKKMKQKNLLESLKSMYSSKRALQLYQFYVFYSSDDENKRIIKQMYSRSQIYRNFKQIRDAI